MAQAVANEEAGLEIEMDGRLVLVDELQERLDADPALKDAFERLTPGRQREYNLYFSDATQLATRRRRVDKYIPRILDGRGFRD